VIRSFKTVTCQIKIRRGPGQRFDTTKEYDSYPWSSQASCDQRSFVAAGQERSSEAGSMSL
jgi:hypothetical protein